MNLKNKEVLKRDLGLNLATQVIASNCPKTLKETRALIYMEAKHAKEMSLFYSELATKEWDRYCELTDAEADLWPQEDTNG